jgi:uncharacterized protein (DUF934 family)
MLHDKRVAPRRWRVVNVADAAAEPGTIIPLARWLTLQAEGADLSQVGAIIAPDADLEPVRVHLSAVPVFGIHFPRFGDGRGYSHARRLRYLWGYGGHLLAFGDVLRDQLVWMWRVGIDQFHLRPYEAITTVAVKFWYVLLFDHAGGSSLITLIAHAAEGSINIGGLYPEDGGDATRAIVFNLLLWCAVAVTLLVAYRRFWTSPAPDAAREPADRDRPHSAGRTVTGPAANHRSLAGQ